MINIRNEGETVKQGFNFYPLSSSHIGFVLRIKNKTFTVRYSKIVKRFVVTL
jgi:hypothetical protein